MRKKGLRELQELAAMVRDREMAKLAQLNAAKQRLEAEHIAIGEQASVARREGTEDLMLFAAAERFATWSRQRQSQILQQIAALEAPIAFQTAKTAKALGRNDNLGKISEKMKVAARKKAANKS